MTDQERAAERRLDYCRQLEMTIAMLVVLHGEAHEGGYRLRIHEEAVEGLRSLLGTTEPVVLQRFDITKLEYVIDVL